MQKMVHECISYNYSSMYRTSSDNLVLYKCHLFCNIDVNSLRYKA